jgi:hypothetical protein
VAPAAAQPAPAPAVGGGQHRRRRTTRWSKAEEQLLEQLVGRYGVGCWTIIRDAGGDGFATIRTAVSWLCCAVM